MNEVITMGVDLAKNVFQVHGVDAEGETRSGVGRGNRRQCENTGEVRLDDEKLGQMDFRARSNRQDQAIDGCGRYAFSVAVK